MEIKQNNSEKEGLFFMEVEGKQIAGLYYVYAGASKFIIDHTEVDQAYEGKGLGKQLLKAAVEYARTKQMHIVPLCPFANRMFNLMPEYGDVLAR